VFGVTSKLSRRELRGIVMSTKRYRSNYSLWPEQARPRRTISMTLAAGGFAIGIVCAIAAHNVVTDFLRPPAPLETTGESAIAQVPIYATAAAPATASDQEPTTRNRTRSVAKVTLPSIGTTQAATDGRGGNGGGRVGDALGGEPNAAASAQAAATTPIPTPAPESVAEITPAEESEAEVRPPPAAKRKARTKRKARSRRTAKRSRRRQPSGYQYGYQSTPFFGRGRSYRRGRQRYYGRRQFRRQYY
jgi:hypothetical protein